MRQFTLRWPTDDGLQRPFQSRCLTNSSSAGDEEDGMFTEKRCSLGKCKLRIMNCNKFECGREWEWGCTNCSIFSTSCLRWLLTATPAYDLSPPLLLIKVNSKEILKAVRSMFGFSECGSFLQPQQQLASIHVFILTNIKLNTPIQ